MRRSFTIFLVLLTASVLTAQSRDVVIQKIKEEGSSGSQVMQLLDHLTNRIGPRLTGSERLIQACEWATERFRSWGLEAKMEKWGEFDVGFNRGPWRGAMVAPRAMALTFGTNAWTAGTKGKVRAHAIMAPATEEEYAAIKEKMKGAWVLELGQRKVKRAWRARLREIYDECGAMGLIRSTGSALVQTGGSSRVTWDNLPSRIRINMIKDHYDAIAKELEAKHEVILEFDIRNYFKKGPVPLYNVIADLKGTEKPEEYVVVGGHIDSWDGATGTTDNGTGTTSTMEAARILAMAGARPKRTIRFMLWSGEEQGLLGSRAWCKAHQDELTKISAVFVHDMGTNYVSGLRVTPEQYPVFEKVVAPVLGLHEDMPFKLQKSRGGLRGMGGSDHASFLAMGVPGFFWNQSGRVKYGYGWHTQNDTYDIAIPEYQRHTSTVVALIALGVADLPEMVSRKNLRSARGATPMRRRMGVTFERGSLKVEEVRENSAAARAGLKPGDLLIALGGVELKDRYALREAMQGGQPEKQLRVKRNGQELTLTIKWPARRGSSDG